MTEPRVIRVDAIQPQRWRNGGGWTRELLAVPDAENWRIRVSVADIESDGPSFYDRTLYYWIAELILEGAMVSETVEPLYVGFRANGLGTYDDDQGYLLDRRYKETLGYNMESVNAYSVVVGWRLLDPVTIRAEYTAYDIDLVKGVTGAIRDDARRANFFAIDVRVAF